MAENVMQTQTVTQRMDPTKVPYYDWMMQGAQGAAMQPYTPFTDQRIAGLTPLEMASYSGIAGLAQQGPPQAYQMGEAAGAGALNQMAPAAGMGYGDLSGIAAGYNPLAAGAMNAMGQYGGQFGSLGSQAASTQMWPGADHAAYMNPYQQNVTDIAAREIGKMAQSQMSDVGSAAAMAGAFGGSRHGLLEGDVLQNARQQIGDMAYQGQRDAYGAAMNQFNADRQAGQAGLDLAGGLYSRGLDAAKFGYGMGMDALQGQQNALMGANQLYQQGAQGLMSGAGAMAEIGGMGQSMNLDLLNAMNQAGTQQRGVQQAMLDVGYQDYLRQQQYPWQQLGNMSNIFSGLPSTGDTSFYSHQQPTSLFNSLLGTGIGAAAMYNNTQP